MFRGELMSFIAENFERTDFCDKSFLEEFRKVLIGSRNLRIDSIEPAKLDRHTAMTYFDNKILFDMDRVLSRVKFYAKPKGKDIITNDHIAFEFYIGILHERIHIIQYIIEANKKDKSAYTEILRDSDAVLNGDIRLGESKMPMFIQRALSNYLYIEYHDIFPEERHANVLSHNVMVKLYEWMYPDRKNILENFKNVYLGVLMLGYDLQKKYSCPIDEFYSRIKRRDIFESFDFSGYSSYERFLYGMPLSMDEIEDQKKRALSL